MSVVKPTITSPARIIPFLFAPGATEGISTKTNIKLRVEVDPASMFPNATLQLKLAPGNFRFNNHSTVITKELGKIKDGDSIEIDFIIICSVSDPAEDLKIDVFTNDNATAASNARFDSILYGVEKRTATALKVKSAFFSKLKNTL